jgi:hypothetical protein
MYEATQAVQRSPSPDTVPETQVDPIQSASEDEEMNEMLNAMVIDNLIDVSITPPPGSFPRFDPEKEREISQKIQEHKEVQENLAQIEIHEAEKVGELEVDLDKQIKVVQESEAASQPKAFVFTKGRQGRTKVLPRIMAPKNMAPVDLEKLKVETIEKFWKLVEVGPRELSLLEKYTAKNLKKMLLVAQQYEDWYKSTSRPSFIKDHGEMAVYEFMKVYIVNLAPNTCWTKLSSLKQYLLIKYQLPEAIKNYPSVSDLLKKNQEGYLPNSALHFEMSGPMSLLQYWAQNCKSVDNETMLWMVASLVAVFMAD